MSEDDQKSLNGKSLFNWAISSLSGLPLSQSKDSISEEHSTSIADSDKDGPHIHLHIIEGNYLPKPRRWLSNTGTFSIHVRVIDPSSQQRYHKVSTLEISADQRGQVQWRQHLHLNVTEVKPGLILRFKLMSRRHGLLETLGYCEMSLEDLCYRRFRSVHFSDPSDDNNLVLQTPTGTPTTVKLMIVRQAGDMPEDKFPGPFKTPNFKEFETHVMLISRGTRGDVQPFVALALALANSFGWLVTIVTEVRFADYVKKIARHNWESRKNEKVRGYIQFRASGGDTQARVESTLGKWALQNGSDIIQSIMMGKAESSFFGCEGAIYHWAQHLRPQCIIFGFTLTNIAMIISESLNIPVVGFILQPTCIPSAQYPPLYSITQSYKIALENELKNNPALTGSSSSPNAAVSSSSSSTTTTTDEHISMSRLKNFFESYPFGLSYSLDSLRVRRGLKPLKHTKSTPNGEVSTMTSTTWSDIISQDIPIVVPINEYAFGGKPADWSASSNFSDFIYLPSGGPQKMPGKLDEFIKKAKKDKKKLVIMGFSSMPVPRREIFDLARMVSEDTVMKPRVIVVVTPIDPVTQASRFAKYKALGDKLEEQGNVHIANSAPFQLVFPLVDACVIHGGLGTTADAMRAGIPIIVTGVLLMDQRFWGIRAYQMGIGPFPCRHTELRYRIVEWINTALDPKSVWAKNAKEVSEKIKPKNLDDADGLLINANAIKDAISKGKVYNYKGKTLYSVRNSMSRSPKKSLDY